MVVDIIIPTYNSKNSLLLTIKSIQESTNYPHRFIIVDASNDVDVENIVNYLGISNITTIIKDNKEGVVKAFNIGMQEALKHSNTEYLLLTHDDVIFFKCFGRDWLQGMIQLATNFYGNDGLFSTLNGCSISGVDYAEGFRWIGTWFILIPKKTVQDLGLFDENFSPGNGEDIEYSFRAFKAGKSIGIGNYWVDHHHSTEHYNDEKIQDLESLKMRNSIYFKKKYGVGFHEAKK